MSSGLTCSFNRELSSALNRALNLRLNAALNAEANAAVRVRVPGTVAGGKTAAVIACQMRRWLRGCHIYM
jgi:hypothetical protein